MSHTALTRLNRASFRLISSLCAESFGLMRSAMSFISLLLLVSHMLKKTALTSLSSSPLYSNASIVFSKVGSCGLEVMAFTSCFCCRIPSSKAGMKCSGLSLSNAGTPYGVPGLEKKRVVHIKVIFFFLMMAGNQQARHHRKQQFFIYIPNY